MEDEYADQIDHHEPSIRVKIGNLLFSVHEMEHGTMLEYKNHMPMLSSFPQYYARTPEGEIEWYPEQDPTETEKWKPIGYHGYG